MVGMSEALDDETVDGDEEQLDVSELVDDVAVRAVVHGDHLEIQDTLFLGNF